MITSMLGLLLETNQAPITVSAILCYDFLLYLAY